jgi:thioredoxin-like negative regulator of GroEL
VAALALVACGDGAKGLLHKLGGGSAQDVTLPPVVAPDDAELQGFVDALLKASAAGDMEELAQLIDWDALMKRSTAGLGVKDADVTDARKGLLAAAKDRGIFAVLASSGKKPGGVHYLEQRSKATRGERWATFRIMMETGAFDHYAFLLNKRKDGRVLAVDWHLLSVGEDLSSMLRRMLSPLQSDQLAAIAARLNPDDALALRYGSKLIEMQKYIQSEQPQKALDVYHALPKEAQDAKLVLITRIGAAQKLGDEQFRQAIEALIAKHPSDPTTSVYAIDGYTLRKDYRKALEAIARLQQSGGPDAYFHVLRLNTLVQLKDYDAAHQAGLQALQEEPDLDSARWGLVTIGLARKDFADTAKWMEELAQHGAADLAQVSVAPLFSEFAASEPGKQLLASGAK